MRRALNARDKGCVICAAPPINCDAHHLQSWIDGGITAINNLALICRRHHTALHNGHWTITITNGEVQVSRPTWADPPGLLKPLPPRPSDQNPPHTDQPAEGGPNHPCLVQPTAGIERGSTRITSSESGSTWPGSTEPGSTRITSSESGSTWPGSTEPGSTEITSSELRRGG
jgi:hypothetical protein